MARGRPKKTAAATAAKLDDDENTDLTIVSQSTVGLNVVPPPPIDVGGIVNDVRALYKKEKGLAKDLVSGDKIVLSQNRDDYVTSDEIEAFWTQLTGLLGFPFGRIIQISGRPDSGKSTLAMMAMVAAQKAGIVVVLWDSENKFSARRFVKMGGVPEYLLIARGRTIIEGATQATRYISTVKKKNPDAKVLVVWDSVGATENSKEDNDDSDDYSKQPGVSAKEVTWAIKKLNKAIIRNRNVETGVESVSVICINQVYTNIGSHGYKEKGGEGLYYLSSIILQLARKKDLERQKKGEKMKYGILTRAKVKKNHLFDGDECVAALDLVVSAEGIQLAKEVKSKASETGVIGWDKDDEEDDD